MVSSPCYDARRKVRSSAIEHGGHAGRRVFLTTSIDAGAHHRWRRLYEPRPPHGGERRLVPMFIRANSSPNTRPSSSGHGRLHEAFGVNDFAANFPMHFFAFLCALHRRCGRSEPRHRLMAALILCTSRILSSVRAVLSNLSELAFMRALRLHQFHRRTVFGPRRQQCVGLPGSPEPASPLAHAFFPS